MQPAWRAGRVLVPLAIMGAALPAQGEITFAEDLFPELINLMYLAAGEGTEMQVNALRVEERQGDVDVARGQRLPRVNMYARLLGAYEWREDIDDRFRGNVNANIAVTQPLYHWGNLERRQDVAESRVALEQVEAERRGLELVMRLRRTYLEWVLVKEQRDILSQSISLSESYVTARRQLVAAGRSSEQDVLEMEARLLENLESLAWADKRIMDLEATLRQLVGPS
ncbi:MAG TPA: TolC family protein, partial [Oceanipulchritudo sp.]|nr:TolC family protein [Oceanipulchritudo sp.]